MKPGCIADLTASNPTRCGFAYEGILDALLGDARARWTTIPSRRDCRLRAGLVCTYYADHGAIVEPDQVILGDEHERGVQLSIPATLRPG